MATKKPPAPTKRVTAAKKPVRGYEPPKLVKFEKLERLIVSGE